ncbi:MAG: diacylglycerol kinase family lipid kinase [Firmicutes bacterium]|nr:diacylglycerol kinase family lipid kinase [Bacillota bacterium]
MPDQKVETAAGSPLRSAAGSSVALSSLPSVGSSTVPSAEAAVESLVESVVQPGRRRGPVKFIVNPASAHGRTEKDWPKIAAILERLGVPLEASFTRGPGDGIALARQAAYDGYWLVVGVGGDGTTNEIVNGLMEYRAEPSVAGRRPGLDQAAPVLPAVGVIPVGTGNDLARSLYIPRKYEDACRRIAEGQTVFVDLGRMVYRAGNQERSRYFINEASTGFSSEVADRTNRMPKVMRGTLTYLISVFITLAAFRNQRVEVKIDDQTYQRRVNSIVVANGNYFGGGMFVAPNAQADDGLFDCVVLGDFSTPELVVNFPRIYRGTHLTHPKVEVLRGKRVEVISPDRTILQADGEILGGGPIVFTLVPHALEMVV